MRKVIYGFAAVLVIGAVADERGNDRKPAPEYQLEVSVFLCDSTSSGQLLRQPAEVVLRDKRGTPIFQGHTDSNGSITLPVDYRSLDASYQLEARLDLGHGEYIGGLLTPGLRSKHYDLFIPTPVNIDNVRVGAR